MGLVGGLFLLREWCFGFPNVVLVPPETPDSPKENLSEMSAIVGKVGRTVTPISPTGEALIDERRVSVCSADGRLIESGVDIIVAYCRNGWPCIQRIAIHDGEAIGPGN